MPLCIDACAAMHIGDRAEQQDRVLIIAHPSRADCLLAVLSDGMGGHSGGAIAAEQVILMARQNFASYAPAGDAAPRLLRSVIEDAHVAIRLARFTSESDPHSTAVVLVLQPGTADWAHCGDSRLYHFRSGELVTRTEDHSLVNQLVRSQRITEEMAQSHPQRNLLVSCLGAERAPSIEFGDSVLQGGDCFLLCSDGLWGLFDDAELGHTLESLEPRAAARVLINVARERSGGRGDNISLAIIKIAATRQGVSD